MDYETFVNTAFLRQGDADRFTTATPAKRKEVLAEVLDLSYYADIEDRARARSRDRRDAVRDLDSAIAVRRQETSHKAERRERLASVETELERLDPEVDALQSEVHRLRIESDSLRARRAELEQISRRIAGAESEVAELERQASAREARVRRYEDAVANEEEIRRRYGALEESRLELDRLGRALARKSALDGDTARLER